MQVVKFNGSGFEYFKIWIVNILLTIVTLSLYYPWAKVRNHRYFYANTQVGDHNFEYHATGKQLFPGYLVALVLLILYVVLQQFSPIGSLVVLLILFLGFPWIIWKSLQFNLKMTSYANVRFSFVGSLGDSYFNFMLLLILAVIGFYSIFFLPGLAVGLLASTSMGLASILGFIFFVIGCVLAIYGFAYKNKKNTEYLVNFRKFGNGTFTSTLKTAVFAKIILKTFLISIAAIVALIGVLVVLAAIFAGAAALSDLQNSSGDPQEMMAALAGLSFLILPTYALFILTGLFISAYAQVRMRNYIYAQSSLDNNIHFKSDLSARKLAWVMFTNLILVVFTLGLGTPWAKVRLTRHFASYTYVETEVDISHYITEKQNVQTTLGDQIGDAFDIDLGITI
jgi:uncharacterized membrane protein YjgN (DUF898 family)